MTNEYNLEFIHLKKKYNINYTIQTVPYKKGFIMYRLAFPLTHGSKKELVVFKDKAGKFSTSSVKITVQQVRLLQSALREIKRIERSGTQTIIVHSH